MKVTRQFNHRVEVTPYSIGWQNANHERLRRDCEELLNDIEKHCEPGDARVEWDEEDRCEYCNAVWDDHYGEDWEIGENAFCCEKAEVDYYKSMECVKCGVKKDWGWAHDMVRCSDCGRWYCKFCFGHGSECLECYERKRREEEEKRQPPGRSVRL